MPERSMQLPHTACKQQRRGRWSRVRTATLCLTLLVAVFARAEDPYEKAQLIRELRAEGQYELAIEAAEQLMSIASDLGDPLDEIHWQSKAGLLLETLRSATSLSSEDRGILTQADSLLAEKWALGRDGRWRESIAAGEKALDLYERLLGPEHPEVIDLLLLLAQNRQNVGDLDGADRDFGLAAGMARRVHGPDSHQLCGILAAYGQFLAQHAEKPDAAELCYREALGIWGQVPESDESPSVAITSVKLAHLLLEKGRHREARELSLRAVSLWEGRDGDWRFRQAKMIFYPDALGALARSQEGLGELESAEESFKKALASDYLFEIAGVGADTRLATLIGLAGVQVPLGHYEEAASTLRLALELLREADDLSELRSGGLEADLLYHMARANQELGRLAHAEPLLRESLAAIRSSGQSAGPKLVATMTSLAAVLYTQGDFLGAEDLLREALTIQLSDGAGDADLSGTLRKLGDAAGMRGDYAEAERLLGEAHDLSRDADPAGAARCLADLAGINWMLRRHEAADRLLTQAIEEEREAMGADWAGDPWVRSCLATFHAGRGEYEEAEELLRGVVTELREEVGSDRELSASLSSLGALETRRGEMAEAESLLAESAAAYERARSNVGVGYARATFWKSLPYDRLACVRALQDRPEEAWATAERGLARALADFLMLPEVHESDRCGSLRDSLESALSYWEGQVEAHRNASDGDTSTAGRSRLERARTELLAAEAEWARYQASVWARLDSTGVSPIDIHTLQSRLPDHCALVGWIASSTTPRLCEPWGYVIRNTGGVSWFQLPAFPNPEFHDSGPDMIRRFRDDLSRPSSAPAGLTLDGTALWRQWFAPLEEALQGVQQLVVVPSGGLQCLPVEALSDSSGVHLCDRYTVSYAPSATLFTRLSGEDDPAAEERGLEALIIGDPIFSSPPLDDKEAAGPWLLTVARGETLAARDIMRAAIGGNDVALASLPRLRGTRQEAEGVSLSIPRCEVLLGLDASEERLVELAEAGSLARFDVIHIATHALVDDESPEKSALVLSQVGLPDLLEAALEGARVYDGVVTAKEVAEEWVINADIVVLSACRTGLGREVAGEGYIGLSHAFFRAGARSIIVSLWKVDDQATALLMRRFYENRFGTYDDRRASQVGEPMTKADALQEAKRWLRGYADEHGNHPYGHPYYWSAFILIGDPS